MSLRQKVYEGVLSNFKEEVRRNPDADFTPKIQELAARFLKQENEREQHLIHSLLLDLYEGDTQSLRKDITKVITLGTAKSVPSHRAELLRFLCEELSLHTEEDFSDILALCDRLESGDEGDENE